MIAIGSVLYGYCGGAFGRDSYEDKRVEAIGVDWIVVRGERSREPDFFSGDLSTLEEYLSPDGEEG